MSPLESEQLEIARTLFGLRAAEGFVLAGGSALLARGAIDRPTRDVDAFIPAHPGDPPGDVRPLTAELTDALGEDRWNVTTVRSHVTFTRLVATRGDISVEIDLAVDSPPLFPVEIVDGLPVLAPQDLAARKVLAILDRAEGRDFADLHGLSEKYGRDECVDWAQQLDAGLTRDAIADAFGHLQRLDDEELPVADPAELRSAFGEWAAELRG